MGRRCRRVMGILLAVCMLISVPGMTAFAANPVGTQRLVADFEGITSSSEAEKAYGITKTMKVNEKDGAWQSAAEVSSVVDAMGDEGTALHFYWDMPKEVTVTNAGTDALWAVTCLDYSGSAVTGFDFKLDNDISKLRLHNRYLNDQGKPGSVDFAALSVKETIVWGQPVGVSLEAGRWYHLSMASSYDEENQVIVGSAWLDGTQIVSGVKIPYAFGAEKLNGNTDNMLRFVCDYSAEASAESKPGYWVDNLLFDQMNSGEVITSPKNNETVSNPIVSFTFPADIDPSTLDVKAITVLKDNAALVPAEAKLYHNRLRLKLSLSDSLENGKYVIKLPDGVKDVLGYDIPKSAQTLTFSGYSDSGASGEVAVTSPARDSYLTYGRQVILQASAAKGSEVSFAVDGVQIGTAEADEQGIASFAWTPDTYGNLFLTASVGDQVSAALPIKVMRAKQMRTFNAGEDKKITDGSAPVDAEHSEVYKVESGKSFGPNDFDIISGIWEFDFDVHTDENSNGTLFSLMLHTQKLATGSQGVWRGLVKINGGKMSFYGSGETGVCAPNTWYNIRIVVDMDAQLYDVFVDGKQAVSRVNFENPGDPITKLFRIKAENSPGTATVCYSPVSLDSLSEVDMNISAKITSPASGTLIEKNQPITLTATAATGDGSVTADSLAFYCDGEKLGDAVKQEDGSFAYTWTPTVSGSAVLFAAAAAGSKSYRSDDVEVHVLGDTAQSWNKKSVSPENSTVTKGDGTAITTTTSNIDSAEPITLNYDGTAAPYTQIGGINKKAGFVVIEADVTLKDAGSCLRIYNRPNGVNNAQSVMSLEGGKVAYYLDNSSSGIKTDSEVGYEYEKPVRIKMIWNVEKKTIDLYVNHVRMAQRTTVREDFLNVDGIRFASDKKNGSIILQNENVRYIMTEPEVSAVAVKNAAGETLDALNMYAGRIASVEAVCSTAMDAGTVNADNVKLYRGSGMNAEVPVAAELLADGKTISVKPQTPLTSAAEYRLVISGEIASAEGAKAGRETVYSFRTMPEGKGAENGKFEKDGVELTDLSGVQRGDTVTFTADLTSTVAERDVWIVLALYGVGENGEKSLKDVSVTKVNMTSVQETVKGSLNLECDVASGDTLLGYVWNSTYVPFSDEFHVSKV